MNRKLWNSFLVLSFFFFFLKGSAVSLSEIYFPICLAQVIGNKAKKKKILPWPTEMFYFTLLCKSQTTQVFPLLQVCGFVK